MEAEKKIKIWMGIPSTGNRSDAQCYALRRIEERYRDKIELVYPKQCIHRIFHDFARNEIVREFQESDCDILWFLDSDIVPPDNILDIVMFPMMEWKLAGAPYPVFLVAKKENGPQVLITVYKRIDGKLAACDAPQTGIEEVDGLATGCLFIRREVFDKLEKPYFEFKYKKENMFMYEGEDLGFCRKVNELGYKFYTDYSMVCKHYKTVDLLDMNNYALALKSVAILQYDEEIRPKVEKLIQTIKTLQQPKSSLILPERLK